jgi:beta-N-acetylhexosaminidase
MNFAPVADVLTNPANQAIGSRAYGNDAEQVSAYVGAAVRGFQSTGVCAVLKHFPGHGDTAGDTHAGPVVVNHDMQRLRDIELLPFQAGIQSGASAVMTGHIALPEVTGSNEAATFSRDILQDLLRDTYAFDGVVISDALTMGAVTSRYTPEEAAIRAFEAGVDILLRPVTPQEVHTAIIEAVHSGRLSVERINRSVARVLRLKLDCSVLVPEDELFRARAAQRPAPTPEVVGSAEHRTAVERIFGTLE